jgi:hypothetical protein
MEHPFLDHLCIGFAGSNPREDMVVRPSVKEFMSEGKRENF